MSAHRPGSVAVLVVGDANPDLIVTGDVVPRFGQREQLLDDAVLTVGGSASITAHGLARLGRPVRLTAAIGADDLGRRLAADLERAGVDLSAVRWRPDVPTGLTVVLAQPDDRAILTLPGAIPTLTVAEVSAVVGAMAEPGHLHVASPFLQPALLAGLGELLGTVRAQGWTTSLDTGDDPSGTWLGIAEVLPQLDVFLPNRAEALALGGSAGLAEAAGALAASGPLVVVKDGAAGAWAAAPGADVVRRAAPTVVAVDTTGAGDSFDAAFLDAWLDHRPVEECLARAIRAGAFAVQALGGVAGQPTAADLDAITERDAVHHES